MLQATVSDGVAFDPLTFGADGLSSAEVDIGRREVVDALMVAMVVVVFDEGTDLSFEISGQIVVVEQDAVLQGLMPALDLALRLGMIRSPTHVLHVLALEPGGEIVRDVARSVVAQKPWPLHDGDVVETGGRERLFERGSDVGSAHRRAQPPGATM